jgi:hypothetical protein
MIDKLLARTVIPLTLTVSPVFRLPWTEAIEPRLQTPKTDTESPNILDPESEKADSPINPLVTDRLP